jgi:hypothetical protein
MDRPSSRTPRLVRVMASGAPSRLAAVMEMPWPARAGAPGAQVGWGAQALARRAAAGATPASALG